jgi:hypothetical protein
MVESIASLTVALGDLVALEHLSVCQNRRELVERPRCAYLLTDLVFEPLRCFERLVPVMSK